MLDSASLSRGRSQPPQASIVLYEYGTGIMVEAVKGRVEAKKGWGLGWRGWIWAWPNRVGDK